MNTKKFLVQTSRALALALCAVCVIAGCGKDEAKNPPKIDPSAPESYMHDKAFMGSIKKLDVEKHKLMSRHSEVETRYRAEIKTNANSVLAQELKAEMVKLEHEYHAKCREVQAKVRARLRPSKKSSTK